MTLREFRRHYVSPSVWLIKVFVIAQPVSVERRLLIDCVTSTPSTLHVVTNTPRIEGSIYAWAQTSVACIQWWWSVVCEATSGDHHDDVTRLRVTATLWSPGNG